MSAFDEIGSGRTVVIDLSTATMEQLDNMLSPKCTLCGKVLFGAMYLGDECSCSARCRNCLMLFCSSPSCLKALDGDYNDGPEDWTRE